MSFEKDSFIFYRSFFESLDGLSDKSQLKILKNICSLALDNKEIVQLKGIEKNIFTLIKPQIIANNDRYINGSKGGRPKKEKTTGYEKEKTTGFENKKPNVNENVNVNENENVNDNVNVVEEDKEETDSCVDGLSEIIDFYNSNINLATPYVLETFSDYLKEMPKELIIYAMQKAIDSNKKTIQYIKAILNNWSKKGIKTLLQAKEEEQEFKSSKEDKNKKKGTIEQRKYEDLSYLYANSQGGTRDEI